MKLRNLGIAAFLSMTALLSATTVEAFPTKGKLAPLNNIPNLDGGIKFLGQREGKNIFCLFVKKDKKYKEFTHSARKRDGSFVHNDIGVIDFSLSNGKCDRLSEVIFEKKLTYRDMTIFYFSSYQHQSYCVPFSNSLREITFLPKCDDVEATIRSMIDEQLDGEEVNVSIGVANKDMKHISEGETLRFVTRIDLDYNHKVTSYDVTATNQNGKEITTHVKAINIDKCDYVLPAGFESGDTLQFSVKINYRDSYHQSIDLPTYTVEVR